MANVPLHRLLGAAFLVLLAGASLRAADPTVEDGLLQDWRLQDGAAGAPGGDAEPPRADMLRTREILDRARRTLAALDGDGLPGVDRPSLEDLARRLDALEGRLRALEESARVTTVLTTPDAPGAPVSRDADAGDSHAAYALHLEVRSLAREIVLAHPLLDFDGVLFVKRHPGRFAHMCDQYYGSFARPGGGIFILEGFRGPSPRLRDVVGARLPEGSFLSPELSFDGRRILFAYARARQDAGTKACWSSDVCYHIHEIGVDGTGLRQLTDGPDDDFDPCLLPDGRIVFISTRRGGFCRCGDRPVPTYTLHVMEPDGTGIRAISYHETNEWHPALLADGRIAYTRWDYVDRHTNLAHSLWTANPDGSNPAALYGNYNFDRKPWGEWHPAPIPGSLRLIAIAGAHHGYAHGSLIRVDPALGLDGSLPVERLTRDLPFPEAEGFPGAAVTTPHALGEGLWLISYSPRWSTRTAAHEVTPGLYVADAHGNRELLYRDPAIASMDPIPLRARRPPPRLPGIVAAPTDARGGCQGEADRDGEDEAEGEFLLLDVYRSTDPIPRGSVTRLRIVQILPKTTFRNDDPKVSVATQISARHLLGTVPVEADGSARFLAPAGVPLYFQAVGEDGSAVQSMRSITYLQPGERRSCAGCHESRHTAPPNRAPLAARRPPSTIEPGPDGTRPFSFPRLVQPVLDRRCVSCHSGAEGAPAPDLRGRFASAAAPHSVSYAALARKDLVHWFESVNGKEWLPRTFPGTFGARASGLYRLLEEGHEDVRLSREELERIAIWIDLNVPFYGVYEPEHVAAQRAGDAVPIEGILR